MKITYYGTGAGAGIPEIFCSCPVCEHARKERGKNIRTRSQAVVDGVLGLDYSDVFQHTLHGGLDMRDIKHVLITHNHYDHLMSNDILSRAYGMTEPIRFYVSKASGCALADKVQARKRKMESADSNFNGNEVLVEVSFIEPFRLYDVAGYTVIPLPARHGDKSLGAYIYILQKDGKNVLWAHDTGRFLPDTMSFIRDSGIRFDLISLDCTLKRDHPITTSHMDVTWCLETVNALRESGNADMHSKIVLSHIGHLVGRTHDELQDEVRPLGMLVAYDGMNIEI